MPVWMLHKETGSWEQVPEARVPQAYMSGEYGLAADQKLRVVAESGKEYSISPADAEKAFGSGLFRLKSPEEEMAQEQQVRFGDRGAEAFGGGVMRGLTGGLSDVLTARDPQALYEATTGREVDEDQAQTLREVGGERLRSIREANRGASLTGEIAGTAGLVVGGATAAAPQTALGLIGVGATEGALLGATGTAGELTLEGEEVTAEKIMAGAGLGGLLGAGTGGLFAGGGVLGRQVAKQGRKIAQRYLDGRSSGNFLRQWAERRAVSATGARLKDFRTTDASEHGRWLLDKQVLAGRANLDDITTRLQRIKDTSGEAVGNTLRKLDDLERTYDMGAFTRRIRAVAREATETVNKNERVVQGIAGKRATRRVWNKIKRSLDDWDDAGEKLSFTGAEKERRQLYKQINWNKPKMNWNETDEAMRALYFELRSSILDTAEEAAKDAGVPRLANELRVAKRDFHHATKALDVAQDYKNRLHGYRWFSPTDYGSMFGGTAIGAVTGDEQEPGKRIARALAYGAGGYAVNRFLLRSSMGTAAVARTADSTGDFIERMAKREAVAAQGQRVSAKIRKSAEKFLTAETKRATRRAATSALQQTSYIKDARRSGALAASVAAGTTVEAFRQRAEELSAIASQPEVFAERVGQATEGADDVLPGLGDALATKATTAAALLYEKMPKNPAAARTLNPAVQDWRPSDMALAKFERYVDAVENPMQALEDLEAGQITREQAEVLKRVYPEMYGEIQQVFMGRIVELQQKLPYWKRLQLSNLFEIPVDASMSPEFVAGLQEIHAAQDQQKALQEKQMRTTAVENFELSQSAQTPAQRLMAKGKQA